MNEIMDGVFVKPDRSRVFIRPNEYVALNGAIFKITQLIDFDSMIGIDVRTGKAKQLPLHAVTKVDSDVLPDNGYVNRDLDEISDSDWREIERRFEMIKPLLNGATRKEIEGHANKLDIHFTTLYRWLRSYNSTGVLIGLLPKKPGCTIGTLRIEKDAEDIIATVIDEHYLTAQRHSPQRIIELVNIECKKRNLQAPSKNTIRARINQISEEERLKRQGNRSKARTLYNPAAGMFPNVEHPLNVVQIDHTPVDIILVDDDHRLPIGRPWITLVIDIYSRMVTGYYLSLDAPSETSVAMCISHSVLPKDNWLVLHGIEATWPVWGFMQTIHVDNGADFRSETLRRSCLTYNINLEFRPVGQPNFGGHIERLLGTVLKQVHSLPGTTFSNIKERDTYNSDKHASMTFSEFEIWLVTYITKVYHKKKHSALGMSPEQQWEKGIFGDLTTEGVGYLPKPSNADTILIDFLPLFSRTIQKNGVNIDGLNYYDNVFRVWINSISQETKKKQTFIFRRDPRDISYVWFFEPKLRTYYRIPLANQAIPSMNLWEYRSAKEKLKEKGRATATPDHELIAALEDLHKQTRESVKKSKKARRNIQKNKLHGKSKVMSEASLVRPAPASEIEDDFWNDDGVVAFD